MINWINQLIIGNKIISVSSLMDPLPGADTVKFNIKKVEIECNIKFSEEVAKKIRNLASAYKKRDLEKLKAIVKELSSVTIEGKKVNLIKKSKRLTAISKLTPKKKRKPS